MPVLLIMRPRVDFSLHLSVSLFLSLSLFPQLLDMILPPQHHCIVLQISSQSALCCAVCAVRSLCMTGLNGRDIGALECSHFFSSLVTSFYLWSLPEIVRNSGATAQATTQNTMICRCNMQYFDVYFVHAYGMRRMNVVRTSCADTHAQRLFQVMPIYASMCIRFSRKTAHIAAQD